jgi:hypothetical protein
MVINMLCSEAKILDSQPHMNAAKSSLYTASHNTTKPTR